jgi:glycerophosphoryl diester phosphodiesterase
MKNILLLLLLIGLSSCQTKVTPLARPIKIITHRGVHTEIPENTLASIQKAIDMKLDFVEVDVRTTLDGHLVLMHDRSLKRTTGADGLVAEKSLADIKQLSAGFRQGEKFNNIKVPTLEEVLKLMSGKIGVYVDNKDADPEKVVPLLEKYNMVENAVIYSDNKELAEFKKLNPKLNIMPEVDSLKELEEAKTLDPKIVAQVWRGFSEELTKAIHSSGFKVYLDILGDGDNPEGLKRVIAAGVDGIQTDNPQMVLDVLTNMK